MIRLSTTLTTLAAASVLSAQQPTFSTRTESVRVDVLVTEGGRVVNGLGPADFEIRDEGVLQTVELVNFQQLPLHLVLALDLS